jgi:hypothetical protein
MGDENGNFALWLFSHFLMVSGLKPPVISGDPKEQICIGNGDVIEAVDTSNGDDGLVLLCYKLLATP